MIELRDIEGFDWDAGNKTKSLTKHAVSNAESEQVFFNQPLLLLPDPKHSEQEQRFHALGKTNDGRLLQITFTIRNEKIRVISARDMNKKERTYYEKNP